VEVFDLLCVDFIWKNEKNMCKYFSGCGYTVRKILKSFGGLNWRNTRNLIILTVRVCLAYICTIFFLSLEFFLDFVYVYVSMDEQPIAIKKRSRKKLAIWPHVAKGKSKKKMAK